MKLFIYLLLICGLLLGCSTTSSTISTTAEYNRVSQKTGHKEIAVIVVPPSKGAGADATTMGLQSALGEASLPRSIRAGIQSAKQAGYRTYVTGSSRSKTEWALVTALSNARDGELAGAIVYLDPPINSRIMEAASKAGMKVISP